MSAAFRIEVDPDRDLMRMALSGFFDASAVQAFAAERARCFKELRCAPDQALTLADVRGMTIQSQDMVPAFGALLADPKLRSRRLAFVVTSALGRMQLQRAIGRRDAQVFTDPSEAETWLLQGDATASAAA